MLFGEYELKKRNNKLIIPEEWYKQLNGKTFKYMFEDDYEFIVLDFNGHMLNRGYERSIDEKGCFSLNEIPDFLQYDHALGCGDYFMLSTRTAAEEFFKQCIFDLPE